MNHSSFLPTCFIALPPLLPTSLWPTLVAFFLAFAFFIWVHRYTQQHSPDPKTWPFLGSHLETLKNFHHFHDWLCSFFSDQHRTIRLTALFSPPHYLTVDPTNVEHILKINFQNYPKGKTVRSRLFDFLGDGIFNADGDTWKKHRKVASLEFSNRKLRDFSTKAFREDAVRLAGILDTAAKLHHSVDLHDLFMRMTLDSICKVGFGVDFGSLSPSLPDVPFARSFDTVSGIIARRLVNPFWGLQKVLNLGTEKVLKQATVKLHSFTTDVVRKRKEEMKLNNDLGNNEMREDLLSRFIKFNTGKLGGYNDQELCDSILNFVIAGRDTTAITLSWFIYCVCNNSEVGEQVFEETKRVLGLESNGKYSFTEVADRITYDSLSGMHYLHAALTETLRLYPAVPRDGKTALDDDTLPDGTRVKRGDQVSYVPYSMGRMEFLWGKDALEYNPDRWLKDGVFQAQSPFKFSAFQAGPRICLGKDSAYLQMKTTAALLLYFFKFSAVPKHVVQYRLMIVLAMAQGLLVHVSHR